MSSLSLTSSVLIFLKSFFFFISYESSGERKAMYYDTLRLVQRLSILNMFCYHKIPNKYPMDFRARTARIALYLRSMDMDFEDHEEKENNRNFILTQIHRLLIRKCLLYYDKPQNMTLGLLLLLVQSPSENIHLASQ